MSSSSSSSPSILMVVIAFALVYTVWGSTYFFIQLALNGMPPFFLGMLRFIIAGLLMLLWCIFRGDRVWDFSKNKHAMISGVLMLFGGTGAVIIAEMAVPSSVSAIMVSAAPIWFVVFDAANWRTNFKNASTIIGLLVGFFGVIMLFYEQVSGSFSTDRTTSMLPYMLILLAGAMVWAAGSLYSKYKVSTSSTTVNSTWQMLAAGGTFLICSLARGEFSQVNIQSIPASAWWSVAYLVIFGSIVAFSAYVWLLQVRPATQVSTYAYVNPVIAVILGVFFAHESITALQIGGLVVILGSVLLINLSKYRKAKVEAA